MKRLVVILFFALIAFPSLAEDVEADLSVHEIEVSAGFNGSKLLVFGVARKRADVIIVVEGPAVHAKLWTKKRKMGFWVNERPVNFDRVPGFYAIASSKPLDAIVSPQTASDYGLTLASLRVVQPEEAGHFSAEDFDGLKQAQQARELYQENPGLVRVFKNGLFRADFSLPAAVPIGDYKATIYLLKNGKVFSEQDVPLAVNHVGIESSIHHLAHDRPFSYAFLAIFSSLGIGGLAAYLFRRRA